MSPMREMGRLSVVFHFEMSAIVRSFDGMGMMRWMREK